MDWQVILQNIFQTAFTVLITFLIFYLAGIIKKKFGQSMSDRYLKAALLSVKIAEQITKNSSPHIKGKKKKEIAMNIAREILKKEKEKKIDESLLDRTIEASVYEIGRKK